MEETGITKRTIGLISGAQEKKEEQVRKIISIGIQENFLIFYMFFLFDPAGF